MTTQRYYSNVSKTMALQVALNNVTTSVVVDDASGLPGLYPFNVALDYGAAAVEIVSVTNVASNVLTVVRGQEDTVATSHSVGAVIVHAATAIDFSDSMDHQMNADDVHGIGIGANVVGTTTAQTLTNKVMSGASNTFSAIPATAITGTFSNLVTAQSNSSAPSLKVNAAVTPLANIVEMASTFALNTGGQLQINAGVSGTWSQRWYGSSFGAQVAEMSAGGLFTCVGVTSTGAISASGQPLTIGTITAGGTITANSGITVPTGVTVSLASGSTFTNAATATHSGLNTFSGSVNLNATTTFGAASTVAFNNGYTVPSGESGVFASGSTAQLDGALSRDSATARVLMDAGHFPFTTSATATGGANSIQDLAGTSYTFTTPSGRTAICLVTSTFDVLGVAATTASFELLLNVDGSLATALGPILTTTAGQQYDISKAWVVTGLTAGSHTIKLQYRNINGNSNNSIQGGDSRTGIEVLTFW